VTDTYGGDVQFTSSQSVQAVGNADKEQNGEEENTATASRRSFNQK